MSSEKLKEGFEELKKMEIPQKRKVLSYVEEFYTDIKMLHESGHDWKSIFEIFKKANVETTEGTIKKYFSQIDNKNKPKRRKNKKSVETENETNKNNTEKQNETNKNNVETKNENNVTQTQSARVSVTSTATVKKSLDNSHLQKIITDPVTGKQMLNPAMRIRPEDI